MIARLAAAVAIGVALARGAIAQPAPVDLIAAIAPDPTNVRAAILVGPSGQVFAPRATGWHRPHAGGTAAPLAHVARLGGTLYALATTVPPFRWQGGAWHAVPLKGKRRGAAVPGSGPAPALAYGRAIVVATATGWIEVRGAPAAPTALWAASEREVWIAARGAIWKRRGNGFARVTDGGALTGGDAPWRLDGDRARDLATGTTTRARGGAVLAAAHGPDAVWLLVRGDRGVVVEHHGTAVATHVPPPGGWAFLWADRHGQVAIATPTGEVAVLVEDVWEPFTVDTALPAARPGPGAARAAR